MGYIKDVCNLSVVVAVCRNILDPLINPPNIFALNDSSRQHDPIKCISGKGSLYLSPYMFSLSLRLGITSVDCLRIVDLFDL